MIDFTREITNDEIHDLLSQYPEVDLIEFPSTIQEHNLDKICSRILYVLLREYQPTNVLEVGTSWGGSALIIVKALLANQKPFKYVGFEMEEHMKKSTEDNVIPLAPENVKIYGEIKKNLDKVPKDLDFIFWDTNWDYPITEWFLKNIFPRLKIGGLIQIHDWSIRENDGELQYQGGNFEGITYLLKLVKANLFPCRKVFAVWDYDEYKNQSIAASFWIKTADFKEGIL